VSTRTLFPQTTIALIWDFDKTLIPGYMQDPIFQHYDVVAKTFWDEANGLEAFYKENGLELVSRDTLYLNHLLTYVREGVFAGLNNRMLRDFGQELSFYDGLPDFFPRLKNLVENDPTFSRHGINVEHYIVSTGLRQMIEGSRIAEHVEFIWGCEFVEATAPPGYLTHSQQQALEEEPVIREIGYVIDNTTKTRAIFEINKGTNMWPQITVNHTVPLEDRRVPFQNMIYIADGPSDIPVFSILNQYEGKTYGVYGPENSKEFRQVKGLMDYGRVRGMGPADYRERTQTALWIETTVDEIAQRIVRDREEALGGRVGTPPTHIVEPAPGEQGGPVSIVEAVPGADFSEPDSAESSDPAQLDT